MKKKILSALLAFSMIGQSAFAASLKTFVTTQFPASYLDTAGEMFDYSRFDDVINTTASAKASVSGQNSYASSVSSNSGVFDYKVTLEMDSVKAAFDELIGITEASINAKGGSDKVALKNQFHASQVSGNFTVSVDSNPNLDLNGATLTLGQVGYTSGSDIFEIDGTVDYTTNPVLVNFKIKNNPAITIDYLTLNEKKALNDLFMTINGVSTNTYNTALPVTVELTAADVYLKDVTAGDIYGKISFTSNSSTATVTRTVSSGVAVSPKVYTVVDDVTTEIETLRDGVRYHVDISEIAVPEKDGYTFDGWYLDKDFTEAVSGDITVTKTTYLYAKFTSIGGGTPAEPPSAATVVDGEKTDVPVNTEDGKHTVNLDEVDDPEKEGFAFEGWYTDPALTEEASGTIEITEDTHFYPNFINLTPPDKLIAEDHITYIFGYPDGEVKPNANITREEVVAAFYRLLKPEHRATIEATEHSFPDVGADRWSVEEIATMANGGYIVGDKNGNFNPSKPITRAEFVTIAVKFMESDVVPEVNYFSDITGHWAEEAILKAAYEYYWILGYEDGTFRPDNFITRAEAMTIINKMLVRYGDHTSEHAEDWPDVSENDWFYSNVIEATSHHEYDRHDNGYHEIWTGGKN